jgi:hypothetical protein
MIAGRELGVELVEVEHGDVVPADRPDQRRCGVLPGMLEAFRDQAGAAEVGEPIPELVGERDRAGQVVVAEVCAPLAARHPLLRRGPARQRRLGIGRRGVLDPFRADQVARWR